MSFIAKFGGGMCANCDTRIHEGDRIERRKTAALFERPKSVWELKGQYFEVWYEHEVCPEPMEVVNDGL